jgi:hypothetical protein
VMNFTRALIRARASASAQGSKSLICTRVSAVFKGSHEVSDNGAGPTCE